MRPSANIRSKIACAVLAGALSVVLHGCYETVGGDRTQSFAATSNLPDRARGKIQETCTYEPANYFGVGSPHMQERCACYAAGVVKIMSKEELDYYATYGLIPTLSKDKYNEVKDRCAAGINIPTPGDKPQKQKKTG
ncbi:MAG TPA: hypothetical protein VKT73_09095 [Xanthobacteraceae bacterium]|nr:hypothetical protein [Xanthobacteraceae bacterium]